MTSNINEKLKLETLREREGEAAIAMALNRQP
jgi:hypothetical protein